MKMLTAVVLLIVATVNYAQAQDGKTEKGFTALFNGKTLDGWHIMNKGKFSVKDGVIFLDRGRGWLRSDKMYKDFELRVDFRFVSKGADSGTFIRAGKKGGNWPSKGYQIQTMDNNSLAAVFAHGGARPKVKRDGNFVKKLRKKTGEWQSYAITVKGDDMRVMLNGETVTTATGLSVAPGYIGLQGEGGQLEFKNIRVKEF